MELKRKIYDELRRWKERAGHKPLIVEGLRQVGKSYIVQKFAKENYDQTITFDFRHQAELKSIFNGNLDVDTIIRKARLFFPDQLFVPNRTVLVFEEIGDCPIARTSLKSFALDGRYDVMATGSLLGVVNYRKAAKIKIPTGYEEHLKMEGLDFEEYLWACGLDETAIEELRSKTRDIQELDSFTAGVYKRLLKDYCVIGGLPEVVSRFLDSGKNYLEARTVLTGLLQDYRADFGRFVDEEGLEQIDYRLQSRLNMVFDSIPKQLAREQDVRKFKFSEVSRGGRASAFEGAFEWLEQAGMCLRCFNVHTLDTPLSLNADETYFKAFLADTGLLMAMNPVITTREFLNDELGARKGAIYENLAAVLIHKAGFPLFYFADGGNHIEIDFLIEGRDGLILYEEKSTNGKMAASRRVMKGETPYRATCCYKIMENNFGQGEFFTAIPQFCAPFLLEQIREQIENFSR